MRVVGYKSWLPPAVSSFRDLCKRQDELAEVARLDEMSSAGPPKSEA